MVVMLVEGSLLLLEGTSSSIVGRFLERDVLTQGGVRGMRGIHEYTCMFLMYNPLCCIEYIRAYLWWDQRVVGSCPSLPFFCFEDL